MTTGETKALTRWTFVDKVMSLLFNMISKLVITFLPSSSISEVVQLCPTLCDPMDCSLLCSSVHGILQARVLECIAISFSNAWKGKGKVKLLSHVQFFATPWTTAYQAPPPMGFSRQEHWSGVPLPSPLMSLPLSGNCGRPYFWGSKITADGDCSHEIKRRLLLGRKLMTNLDSILKSLVNKGLFSQGCFSQWSCIDVRVRL